MNYSCSYFLHWMGRALNQVRLMSEVTLTGIPRGPIRPAGPGSP